MTDIIPTKTELEIAKSIGINQMSFRERRALRAFGQIELRTMLRMASVNGTSFVQAEKLNAIDRLAREAMSGQALLNKWASTLASGDVFLSDELKFFTDIAKMGKGEIIADTISLFRKESR